MTPTSLRERVAGALRASGLVSECAVVAPSQAQRSQRCTRCALTGSYPGLQFDAAGVCDACHIYESRHERVSLWFRPFAELKGRLTRAGGEHDCLLLYSGGKDSTYALYRLIDLGLRVLTFTFDNGFISPRALQNIERVTGELGVEHVTGRAEAMPDVLRESLERTSSVCPGCFKGLLSLSLDLACERGVPAIVTGLSRGQILEERLHWFHERNIFDPAEIERQLAMGRRIYHGMDEYAGLRQHGLLGPLPALDRVEVVDFYRYCDVTREEILAALRARSAEWKQPEDCGFCSSNCQINDVGISVHVRERGFHNYEVPTAWDVRLGHLSRQAALAELEGSVDSRRVGRLLDVIGYRPRDRPPELTAYCVPAKGADLADLREVLKPFAGEAALRVERVTGLRRDERGHVIGSDLKAAPAVSSGGSGALVAGAAPLLPGHAMALPAAKIGLAAACSELRLELPSIDPALVKRAVMQVVLHHDGLRIRFPPGTGQFTFEAPGGALPLLVLDARSRTAEAQDALVTSAARALRGRISLRDGPVVRLCYIHRGSERPSLLLGIAPPVALDHGSWRLICEDLETACGQLLAGLPVELPNKTDSLTRLNPAPFEGSQALAWAPPPEESFRLHDIVLEGAQDSREAKMLAALQHAFGADRSLRCVLQRDPRADPALQRTVGCLTRWQMLELPRPADDDPHIALAVALKALQSEEPAMSPADPLDLTLALVDPVTSRKWRGTLLSGAVGPAAEVQARLVGNHLELAARGRSAAEFSDRVAAWLRTFDAEA